MQILQILLFNFLRYSAGAGRVGRRLYYAILLRSMGSDCEICGGVMIIGAENINIGNAVIINQRVILQSCEGASITLGDGVVLSYGAQVLTGGIDLKAGLAIRRHSKSPVVIKSNAWIGAAAIILPGVCVGEGAVIAAGSIVTSNVPDGVVVAGSPARVVREL